MHGQYAGGAHVIDDLAQDVRVRAAFLRGATPGVVDDIRRQGRIGAAAVQSGGGDEPLIAFGIGGRRTHPLTHVPAADPARAGRHADAIGGAIVADHGAHGVRAMTVVVAGRR